MSERHGGTPALTRREREIASLIAEGLPDKAIAQRIFRSPRTVEYHVLQIRNKLGFDNRTQIATWFTREAAAAPPMPSALPAPLTSFVGRRRELVEAQALLGATRLLTLTGPGGSGKTRLALRIAAEQLDRYPAGVWFADLSAVRDPERVGLEVAGILGAERVRGDRPIDGILSVIGSDRSDRPRLLILDNCEHLVEGCSPLAEAMLQSCSPLRVICTGREPLHVAGETIWRLGPLGLPEPAAATAALAMGSEAVQLFVERARLVDPGFVLEDRIAAAVVEVVRRLDGIPLALELAAAQLGLMTVDRLLRHLDDHFVLSGRRGVVSRQRTMAATIQWSDGLLNDAERRLFHRLGVFSGNFTLDAAEAVCPAPPPDATVLGLLSALIDKSLVVAARDGTDRYGLLATIRSYCRDRLADSGELDDARRRHYAFLLAWVAPATAALRGPDQARWLAEVAETHDDLLAALDHGGQHEPETVMRLGLALERFWFVRGYVGEGRRRLEALLRVAGSPEPEQALVLVALAKLAWRQGDLAAVRWYIERSLGISRRLDDPDGVVRCMTHLGSLCLTEGQPTRARELFQEGLRLAGGRGDERSVAYFHDNLGVAAILLHDHDAAEAHLTTALRIMRGLGDPSEVANVLTNLGSLERDRGRPAEAGARYRESLAMLRALGDSVNLAEGLEGIALVAAGERPERALRLAAAAAALREGLGVAASIVVRRLIPLDLDALRARLPDAVARDAWAAGRALTFDQAIDLAEQGAPGIP